MAEELNKNGKVASFGTVDVMDWDQQVRSFEAALAEFGRIDYVYPIAGIVEGVWVKNDPETKAFTKPDLTTLEADLTGVLYTVALALQQFRRQEPGKMGFRGKIGCVASVCGFYCIPTLPIYTAAKHAVVGLVRSYGKYLPDEKITLNAVCPNVVRTNLSAAAIFDQMEEKGILTPLDRVVEAFESLLGVSDVSGEIFEVGPNGGYQVRKAAEYLNEESRLACDMLYNVALPLQQKAA